MYFFCTVVYWLMCPNLPFSIEKLRDIEGAYFYKSALLFYTRQVLQIVSKTTVIELRLNMVSLCQMISVFGVFRQTISPYFWSWLFTFLALSNPNSLKIAILSFKSVKGHHLPFLYLLVQGKRANCPWCYYSSGIPGDEFAAWKKWNYERRLRRILNIPSILLTAVRI